MVMGDAYRSKLWYNNHGQGHGFFSHFVILSRKSRKQWWNNVFWDDYGKSVNICHRFNPHASVKCWRLCLHRYKVMQWRVFRVFGTYIQKCERDWCSAIFHFPFVFRKAFQRHGNFEFVHKSLSDSLLYIIMKRVLAALFTNLPAEAILALTDTIPVERKKKSLNSTIQKAAGLPATGGQRRSPETVLPFRAYKLRDFFPFHKNCTRQSRERLCRRLCESHC